jgi:hypothetical protein
MQEGEGALTVIPLKTTVRVFDDSWQFELTCDPDAPGNEDEKARVRFFADAGV